MRAYCACSWYRSRCLSAALLRPSLSASPNGLQDSGSIYCICTPPAQDYNGNLIIWANGFQDAGTQVEIPEDQLNLDGVSITDIINALGYGFATNSYSKTGFGVPQGMTDILGLFDIDAAEPAPSSATRSPG